MLVMVWKCIPAYTHLSAYILPDIPTSVHNQRGDITGDMNQPLEGMQLWPRMQTPLSLTPTVNGKLSRTEGQGAL